MRDVRDAVEATLLGRDSRLVARCDVDEIMSALESYGCYDLPMLSETLQASFGLLQSHVGAAAPPAFLALLKEYTCARRQTRCRCQRRRARRHQLRRLKMLRPSSLPVVTTVKFNSTVIAERSSLCVPPTATWHEVARLRLGEQASEFMSSPLQVHLFPNWQQRESDRVGASISDAVGGSFALGYAFAVLSFSRPAGGGRQAEAQAGGHVTLRGSGKRGADIVP